MKEITLPRTFSQNDPRWKNSQLGTKGTIGAYGCLMTDATMAACYFGKDETPLTVNQKMTDNKGYESGNLFVWSVFAQIFGFKFSGKFSNSNALTVAQMDQIRGAIDRGYPVFLQIDTIPTTSGLDEHWILAIGYDGDDFIVQDPWDGSKKRITSWGVAPQKLIYSWCWYEGKVPAPAQADPVMEIKKSERDWFVGRATTAKEVAQSLAIDNPDNAQTESYVKVIAGIKSSTTACQTTLSEKEQDLARALQEVKNREEQVERIKHSAEESAKLYEAQIDALKKGSLGVEELEKQYKGRITALEGQVDDLSKTKGRLQNDLATCQAGQPKDSPLIALLRKLGL